ncbi:BTAD domain-containing putative transcriptional regulator [Embleya sp. NPDC050154]|uniref:BTAD domain-containing putative transcriptional regulator n=1 Tax=Embleya sp. NPDC050154 TaxID=3363988 RepID=UPI00379CEE72
MHFGVLGPLDVRTADGTPVKVPDLKVRALLADLLAHRGRTRSVDRLVEDLWRENPPANPTAALQTRVSQLRRALERAEPGGRDLVVTRAPGYALHPAADTVDADRFAALAAAARTAGDPRTRAGLLADALAMWRGPAFADFADAEFTRSAAAGLDEQRVAALEAQAEARLELGEHSLLIAELAELSAAHPLREGLRGTYMRALYRAGRTSEALAVHDELRARLADELGLAPGPELAALRQAILTHDAELRPASTPVTSVARPRDNLPAALTDLVGREQAIDDVRTLLGAGRLVTLTGPGGVGKTRLAVAAATRVADTYPDGAWLVELAGHGRPDADPPAAPDDIAHAVTAALDIRDDTAEARPHAGPSDITARLTAALRPRRLLLVLDNCEHVVDAAAALVDRLLRAAPELRILTTSREALGLAGEHLWPVPPLTLPDPTADPRPETLERAGSVRLFVARAAAAAPGFRLDAGNAHAVAAVCRRLDGIPLALELAATRVRALGVHDLADRLDDRFTVLAAGRRVGPARQQTLRAMIDWSWELLTATERAVLRRLAVHADGCTLEAAEAVCATDAVPGPTVVQALARLVDRSLVVVAEGPTGPRYRLLESVAAYCVERAREAGESKDLRRRHDRYYTDLAERAAPHLYGHGQRAWLERLDTETANLRNALDSALCHRAGEIALRLTNALAWYWFLRGRTTEARRALSAALALPATDATARARARAGAWLAGLELQAGAAADPTGHIDTALRAFDGGHDPHGRARAQYFLAFATSGLGDRSVVLDHLREAGTAFRELDDPWGIASAQAALDEEELIRGDVAVFRRSCRENVARFHKLGDRWGELRATDSLGMAVEVVGDYAQAARLHREGLRMAEDLRLWPQVSHKLAQLGRIALLTGDLEAADEFHERALRLAAEQFDQRAEQFAQVGLALAARRRGDHATAERHLRVWLDWNRRRDGDPGTALILAELGFLAEQRGDARAAWDLHHEGYLAARGLADPRAVALALEGLAGAHAIAGRPRAAALLLGAAEAARESVGAPLPPAERGDVDRTSAAVRTVLDDASFAATFARGRGLTAEAAVTDEAGAGPG